MKLFFDNIRPSSFSTIKNSFHKKEDGVETVEFMFMFGLFFALTILLVQISIWFFNALTVNAALSDASQRASARGGLTVDVNNKYMDSIPEGVCGVKTIETGGIKKCSNATLVSDVCDLEHIEDVDGCDEDVTVSDCAANATVGLGEECTKFGDIIKLNTKYKQPWIINFDCSINPDNCSTGLWSPLTFKQQQSVGSQSLIGQNKEVTP